MLVGPICWRQPVATVILRPWAEATLRGASAGESRVAPLKSSKDRILLRCQKGF